MASTASCQYSRLSQAGRQVDNLEFYRDMNVLTYLSQIGTRCSPGKHVRIATLLNRESVSSRLHSQEGISYTEFSYQLLQAYDFLQLHRQHVRFAHLQKCVLQLGGSDQWGNILSGVELVRKVDKQTVFGITTPLLTTAEGKKFGKSEVVRLTARATRYGRRTTPRVCWESTSTS